MKNLTLRQTLKNMITFVELSEKKEKQSSSSQSLLHYGIAAMPEGNWVNQRTQS